MVLEDSTSADSFPVENAPSSDLDPYTFPPSYSSDPNILVLNPNVNIDLRQFPRGYFTPQAAVSANVFTLCQTAANDVKRPLKQEEADALAYHSVKALRNMSWGPTASGLVAAAHVYRTRENYKFPFWTPMKEGSRFTPDAFGPFKGQIARSCWQLARFGAYGLVWIIPVSMVFTSYAMTTLGVGRATDPRLREVNEAGMKAFKERQRQRQAQGSRVVYELPPPGQQSYETFAQAAQRRNAMNQYPREQSEKPPPRTRPVVDDASPTNGSFEQEFMGASYEQDPASQNSNSWGQERSASHQAQSRRQKATPTNTGTQFESTGDAWERVRQRAMSSQGQSEQSSRSTTSGDGFTFGNDERERAPAKEDAQRDFDRRLQQEREGKDFSASGESGRQW